MDFILKFIFSFKFFCYTIELHKKCLYSVTHIQEV